MPLTNKYSPGSAEPRLQSWWGESGAYHFSTASDAEIYSIDTPPPTVSGHLHLGHVYSYSQTDFIARFWRMNGRNVFYPMGYDDNGLPTERLVERELGIRATEIGREAFVEKCLQVSEKAEKAYRQLWERLGLSIDWRYSYRTIDDRSQRIAQLSFVRLYRDGLIYRKEAPTIWCPECRTAIAQAELNDLARESVFYTLAFSLREGGAVEIATTRPELLPACVAIFVHPDDVRFRDLVGRRATVPLFGQEVPILTDPQAEPEKGTGAVMCCTFGDVTDVAWWHTHKLPLRDTIDRTGRMTDRAGAFAGLSLVEARRRIVNALGDCGALLGQRSINQSVRVHERCDTPVEYIVTPQWFARVLDFSAALVEAGAQVRWHPEHMAARYREWVENLGWDWCLSRQRYFGVPIPVWYCAACGEIRVAEEAALPLDPAARGPDRACRCGSMDFRPEQDVLDTWATSSLSPQIVGQWLADPELYARVFPFSLRPQAHEIIRTWAFYTIVKSYQHFGTVPWRDAAISGWALAPEGTGKISKSRGGGPAAPLEMIERYSADAVRYWAASTGFGRDSIISEEKMQAGARLVTKLWNIARFSERFLADYRPPAQPPALTTADRWILAATERLVCRVTALFRDYEYATAKNETEAFLWRDLADNYLEMTKQRLYEGTELEQTGARYALSRVLLTLLKLLAPILPHVTEEIYQGLFAAAEGETSIHTSRWPIPDERLQDEASLTLGETLVEVATVVRRYKTEQNLGLSAELPSLHLATADPYLAAMLAEAEADLRSITRAVSVCISTALDPDLTVLAQDERLTIALAPRKS